MSACVLAYMCVSMPIYISFSYQGCMVVPSISRARKRLQADIGIGVSLGLLMEGHKKQGILAYQGCCRSVMLISYDSGRVKSGDHQ